jgi:hypothetical protein
MAHPGDLQGRNAGKRGLFIALPLCPSSSSGTGSGSLLVGHHPAAARHPAQPAQPPARLHSQVRDGGDQLTLQCPHDWIAGFVVEPEGGRPA